MEWEQILSFYRIKFVVQHFPSLAPANSNVSVLYMRCAVCVVFVWRRIGLALLGKNGEWKITNYWFIFLHQMISRHSTSLIWTTLGTKPICMSNGFSSIQFRVAFLRFLLHLHIGRGLPPLAHNSKFHCFCSSLSTGLMFVHRLTMATQHQHTTCNADCVSVKWFQLKIRCHCTASTTVLCHFGSHQFWFYCVCLCVCVCRCFKLLQRSQ